MRVRTVVGFTVVALCGACDVDVEGGADVELRTVNKNTPGLNGSALNGTTLNALTLNGTTLNGMTVNGTTLNGTTLNGTTLNGSEFIGYEIVDGVPVLRSGTEMIGLRFRVVSDENVYLLAVVDAYLAPDDPAGDLWMYEISVHDQNADTWSPLCTHDGAPAAAVALRNRWDDKTGDLILEPDSVTFACEGAVLAKCAHWGYKPWKTTTSCDSENNCSEVSLVDHHQACTRMARADYCGDGTPHTVNGTLIDLWDMGSPAIQSRTTGLLPNWGVEAEWGPDGAVCVGDSLRLQILDDLNIVYDEPECLPALSELPSCGSLPQSRGGLVANAYCTLFGTLPFLCGG
jgi:hypothetical protein